MQTMDDVKAAMSKLYGELDSGAIELKTAAELANIAGKFLKAEQLMLAREVFSSNLPVRGRLQGVDELPAP